MNDEEIKAKLQRAIRYLYKNDYLLIKNNLSERSITHKLAEYVQSEFPEYHVDCEYNGNIHELNGRKGIKTPRERLEEKGFLKKNEKTDLERELIERAVFPDIIVHNRGSNDKNLCIIEVKKPKSTVSDEYDKIKLEAYTSSEQGNTLKYQLGAFLKLKTSTFCLKYFKDGKET